MGVLFSIMARSRPHLIMETNQVSKSLDGTQPWRVKSRICPCLILAFLAPNLCFFCLEPVLEFRLGSTADPLLLGGWIQRIVVGFLLWTGNGIPSLGDAVAAALAPVGWGHVAAEGPWPPHRHLIRPCLVCVVRFDPVPETSR